MKRMMVFLALGTFVAVICQCQGGSETSESAVQEIGQPPAPQRNSRGLYCPEGAGSTIRSGSYSVARRRCADICGGENRITIFEESSNNSGGGTISYCCGC